METLAVGDTFANYDNLLKTKSVFE